MGATEDIGHYEWFVDDQTRFLTEEEHGRTCSQPRCTRPAILVLIRSAYYWRKPERRVKRRWFCCDYEDHCYGRKIEDGQILVRRWVFTEVPSGGGGAE